MGKSERKRGRSTNDVSIRGVLGSVARAHELVVGSGPWDDATQVSADYCDGFEAFHSKRFNSTRN